MKKKKVLKKWVKVVLTAIVLIIGTLIYNVTYSIGYMAQTSNLYTTLCVLSWFWLLIGQIAVLDSIWR